MILQVLIIIVGIFYGNFNQNYIYTLEKQEDVTVDEEVYLILI